MNLSSLINIFLVKTSTKYWGKKASGILYYCSDDKTILLVKRSPIVENPNTWGIPGGAISDGFYDSDLENEEDPPNSIFHNSAENEVKEELGINPPKGLLIGESEFKDKSFTFKTYIYNIKKEEKNKITPLIKLNWENSDVAWFPLSDLPTNIHFGVLFTLNNITGTK